MVCPWWVCYSFDNPLRRLFHDPERLLDPYVKPGMTVVDIGCGMGYFTVGLAKLVGPEGKVIAVDLQQQMLDALERRARRAGMADRIVLHRCRKESLGVRGACRFRPRLLDGPRGPGQIPFLQRNIHPPEKVRSLPPCRAENPCDAKEL